MARDTYIMWLEMWADAPKRVIPPDVIRGGLGLPELDRIPIKPGKSDVNNVVAGHGALCVEKCCLLRRFCLDGRRVLLDPLDALTGPAREAAKNATGADLQALINARLGGNAASAAAAGPI